VSSYGSADALEFELPNWLDRHGVLDCHQHTGTDENLTGLGFVTKPGSDVGDGPNSAT